jgi:CheY-like chemotaxis protein
VAEGRPNRRVLVVEDDPSVAQVLAGALELDEYEVRTAAHGREALGVLNAWRPDVIVLDLMMPVMDGWTFREEQRRRVALRGIPVVVVSASHHLDARAAGMDAAAVVAKPFDLDALLDTVRRVAGPPRTDGAVGRWIR